MKTPEWKSANLDLIREACRHGESKLQAQVTIATSADQRATVLAGIYAAAAVGTIAALLTSTSVEDEWPLIAGTIMTAITFMVGACFCISATLPVKFWTPGNDPHEWYPDIENGTPLAQAIGEQAAYFDKHIEENNSVLERNANRFQIGAIAGIAAPLVGFVGAGLACLLVVRAR